MARNRMIKPEFWEDEIIGTLTFGARLLFIGMWNIADDEGLLRYNSAYIKSSIFIYDDIPLSEVEKYMEEAITAKLIFPYTGGVLNQRYCYIINFRKHQKIDKPQPSKLPAPSIQNPKVKWMYFERDNMLCHICEELCTSTSKSSHCKSKYPSIDHIIPRSKGGNDYPSNLKTACLSCNKGRGNSDLEEINNDSTNDSTNDSVTNIKEDKEKEEKVKGAHAHEKKKETKVEYKPRVFLTEEKYLSLKNLMGEQELKKQIEDLSISIGRTGRYKNEDHFYTLTAFYKQSHKDINTVTS